MDSQDIGALFDTCDVDAKGYLSMEEFRYLCGELDLDDDRLSELFDAVDLNKDGKIERSEFLERFHFVADLFFNIIEQNKQENENPPPGSDASSWTTSTPKSLKRHRTWDDFAHQVGHVIFALNSYERMCGMYKLLEEDPLLVREYERMLVGVLKDVEGLQSSVNDYEMSLIRKTKQSEEQLSLLEEEMEAQIKIKEGIARSEESKKWSEKSRQEREKYEKQISKLQEAVDKLQKVDDQLSGISPYEVEIERMREKFRHVTEDNSSLRMKLHEAETSVSILRGEISALKVRLQEKQLEHQRECEAVTMALSEQENMSRQVNALYTDNRRLRDSNHNLREVVDTNSETFLRMSRFHRSPSASLISSFSSVPEHRSDLVSGRTSRNSVLDVEALAECDPGLRNLTLYDGDDDTEVDISLKSSLDGGNAVRRFEQDSGIGTIRDDPDSEAEWDNRTGIRPRVPASGRSSVRSSFSQRNKNRSKNNGKRCSLDNVTDDDDTDDDSSFYSEKRSKVDDRRKVTPQFLSPTTTRPYKIILCGDSNVGKSSFILRLCRNKFKSHTRSTLGVDCQQKIVDVGGGKMVPLQVWDTAGQERFRSISASYFRNADGVILLYDITCPDSFINVRDWMETISNSVPKRTPVVICGNKIDLRKDDQSSVRSQEGAQLAASYSVLFIETSASTGSNVLNAVTSLARHLKDDVNEPAAMGSTHKLNKLILDKTNCC